MEELLTPFAYLILFMGSMIKGEAVLITAILASDREYIDLPLVIAVTLVGTVISDHFFYFIGRKKSRDVLWKYPGMIDYAENLYKKLKKAPLRVFISHQFLNGFTQKVPYLTGTSNLKPLAFSLYDTAASVIWIVTLLAAAFILKVILGEVFTGARYFEPELLLAVLVTGLVIQLFIHVKRESNSTR